MGILESVGGNAAWELLKIAYKKRGSVLMPKEVSQNWISRMNNRFRGEVLIYCQTLKEPKIHIDGTYPLTPAQQKLATVEHKRLESIHRPNDPHAILTNDPQWACDPPQFKVKTLSYSDVCALRKSDVKPQVLSSSAIIVCQEAKVILLHERAHDVETYPDSLHTLGGAYIPPGTRGVDADRSGPRDTVQREVYEELLLALPGDEFPPMMISKELDTGFIQVVFLGFGVSEKALERVEGNWEGNPVRVRFDKIPEILQSPQWVPSGKAHILAWLAVGAPNAGTKPRFGNFTASQLFDVNIGF